MCIRDSASPEQGDAALNNVYERLNTKYGAILMDPPYHAHAFDGALAVKMCIRDRSSDAHL